MKNLNVVMYHYVRNSTYSKFRNLKFLSLNNFKKQLNYLEQNFNIIDPNTLFNSNNQLPLNSCMLTFDDGYKDHIKFVYPELKKRKIKAIFFPVGSTIFEEKILETNLIQIIVSKIKNPKKLLQIIKSLCLDSNISEYEYLKLIARIKDKKNPKNRFDEKNIVTIKKLLQFGIPSKIRTKIINILFNKIIKLSIKSLWKNYYLSKDDINKLLDNQMIIGAHTYNHIWLGNSSINEQQKEIELSVKFLNFFKVNKNHRVFCYPFGSYNKSTIQILKKNRFKFAFNTKNEVADIRKKFEIARKDTNDFLFT